MTKNLLEDYLSGDSHLLECYAAAPASLFDTPSHTPAWEGRVLAAVRTYQQHLGLSRSIAGNEQVIATGQQPGLFTGPLYTIYKAITALHVARLAQERTGNAYLPLFWNGADDHDFEETRSTYVLAKSGELLKLDYVPSNGVRSRSMYTVPADPSLHALIDRAADTTAASEYREEVRGFLHDAVDASNSFSDFFSRIMARLFRETPLLLFTPELPEARRHAAGILAKEIAHPLESTRALQEAGRHMESLGYGAQVVKGDADCSFFLEWDGVRTKVEYADGRFILPQQKQSLSQDEMLALLDEAPERFTPNVVLRCIIQQHLFPVAAYVAGPGELAYWGQLKPVFQLFDQPMPIVYPRARCLLLPPKAKKILKKFGMDWTELQDPTDTLVDRALRSAAPNPALDRLQTARPGMEAALADFAKHVRGPESDLALEAMAKTFLQNAGTALDRLESGLLHKDQARTSAIQAQVIRVATQLAPLRKPQERVLNVLTFLFEQGWEFVPRIMNALDAERMDVQEIDL